MKSVIVFILFFSSCTNISIDPSLLFIGDSIIANWDIQQNMPSYRYVNIGKDGTGIEYWLNKLIPNSYDVNIYLIGANDIRDINNSYKISEFINDYLHLLRLNDSKKSIVISILPQEELNNDIISKINYSLNDSLLQFSNVVFIDAYSEFLSNEYYRIEYYRDNIHLSRMGYEVLSKKLISCIELFYQ